jgi:hypothetical protein
MKMRKHFCCDRLGKEIFLEFPEKEFHGNI